MKIVIVTEWFSEKMGYIENCLPKALATLGHEVHIITSNLNVYYNIPDFEKVYGSFLGRPVTECFEKKIDGYMLHRLPHGFIFGKVYIKGLTQKLKQLSPDVVQVFDYSSLTTYQVLMVRMQKFFAFFTANHMVASVFPLFYKNNQLDVKWRLIRLLLFLYRYTFGKLLNAFTEKLHAPTRDAGEIAKRFFGVSSEKIRLTVLGVDTDYFKPLKEEKKGRLKRPFFEKITWMSPIRTQPKRTYVGFKTKFTPEGDHVPYLLKTALKSSFFVKCLHAHLNITKRFLGVNIRIIIFF